MAIDKTIRIQDLPASDFLNSDNLLIINDSDNITRSVTFENLLGSITELPDGINLPPTSPGVPGLSFCDINSPNYPDCGTGIGSSGECQLFISVCGTPVIDINGTNIGVNGDLEIDGGLIVNKETVLLGDVNIGSGCNTDLIINSKTYIDCFTAISGDAVIGTNCANNLEVNSTTQFACDTTFNGDVTFDNDITVGGNITISGEIKPPDGSENNINLEINNINVGGDAIIGDPDGNCSTTLDIHSLTTHHCEVIAREKITASINADLSDGVEIDPEFGVVTAQKLVGDGSGIYNLNIPGSLTFLGSIDVTDPLSVYRIPQTGDLYINTVAGDADPAFNGLGYVALNQFVYYTVNNEWEAGSVQDIDGFVTLHSEQEISGSKTFTNSVNFTGVARTRTPLDTELLRIVNVDYVKNYVDNEINLNNGSLSGDFVTLDTDQTIGTLTGGEKTFYQKSCIYSCCIWN